MLHRNLPFTMNKAFICCNESLVLFRSPVPIQHRWKFSITGFAPHLRNQNRPAEREISGEISIRL